MARPGRVDTDASFRVSLGEVAGTAGVVEMDVGDGHRCHIVDPEMVERCIEVGDGNGGPALDQHPFGRVEEVAGEPLRLAVHTCIDEVQVMSQVGNAYIHQAKTLPVAVSVRAPTLSNARAPRKDCIVDLNLVVLAGRLAAPPEIRQFESGSTLARYLITVRSEAHSRVDVVPVTLWDPPPPLVDAAPAPGRRMWVAGSVQRRFWGGSEGRRSRLEVVASQVCLREAGDDVHQGV